MQTDSPRPEESHDIDQLMEAFFKQARAQWGKVIRSYWFYDGDLCPACSQNKIDTMKIKGQEALSLNAFIYRETGTLIGYFLCKHCAKRVFADARKNPYTQTEVHTSIERNLAAAYQDFLKKTKLG